MLNRKKHELPEDRSINMTPMIDVVFQLILFFMLTSSLAATNHIQLNLPESTTGKSAEKADALVISYRMVGGKPELALNGKKVASLDKLGDALRAVARPQDRPRVDLEIDRNMSMQNGVNLFDCVRDAGFTNFSINTVGPGGRRQR